MICQILDLRGNISEVSGPYTVIPHILCADIQIAVCTSHVDVAVYIFSGCDIKIHGLQIFQASVIGLVYIIQGLRINANPPLAIPPGLAAGKGKNSSRGIHLFSAIRDSISCHIAGVI